MTTTPCSFRRFLRTVGAEVLPYTLKNGDPDPTGRACIVRHRVDSDLPDVVWWFKERSQIEDWWRSVGVAWWARDEQLKAVAQHYRAAFPDERERMAAWQALPLDERPSHPWNATFTQIEQRHTVETVTLPAGWRSWTAREYIKGANHLLSDDPVGDVIAACTAEQGLGMAPTPSVRLRAGG